MNERSDTAPVPRFDRRFFEGVETFTEIGSGAIGGKASGLRRAREVLAGRPADLHFERLEISVPTLAVIGTDVFDAFVDRNGLRAFAASSPGDHHLARRFQQADLPVEVAGDLWNVVRKVTTPLAVRSSSLLEDALEHPFAGVYGTKMTPNDAHDPETRFQRLVEAVKFVWASAFMTDARAAVRASGHDPDAEKMGVIVQEVVGRRHGSRFYPDVSGVARSYNFYPTGTSRPEDGVAALALGLGKAIVDGERTWIYSPREPRAVPPFNSITHMLDEGQRTFWVVRMGRPPAYDPTAEAEYLERCALGDAEEDGTLHWTASTYDPGRDRMVPGTAPRGPRMLNFAPLLQIDEWPFNRAVEGLLELFGGRAGGPVEIEFALTLPESPGHPARLGFLQVRPMAVAGDLVDVSEADLEDPRCAVASDRVLGNGCIGDIRDVVFVHRERFDPAHTREIAAEIRDVNRALVEEERPYLLVGFGRWGSHETWLGIPVTWPEVSGVRAIVEASSPRMSADMSQGAHFFHNLLGFGIPYFSVPETGRGRIDWDWIESLPRRSEGRWVCRAETPAPLEVRVDGRAGRGIVLRGKEPEDG